MVPLKARYNGKDLRRLAEYYCIPLRLPAVSVKFCSVDLHIHDNYFIQDFVEVMFVKGMHASSDA